MTEEPKKFYQGSVKTLFKDRKFLLLLLAGGSLLSVLVLMSVFPKQQKVLRSTESASEINRENYSKSEIENLIKEQTAREMEKKEAEKPRQSLSSSAKRKLDAKIAVYVKEEPKEIKEAAGRTEKKREKPGISTGARIKAHLTNAIFSFNVTSPVIAVADENFSKIGKMFIPKGTQFIGEAGIVQSRDRVNIRFSTMVFPDGREMKIRAMALGLDGSGGLKGKVDKQTDKSILKAVGEIGLAGAALVLGTRNEPLSLQDELRLNASRNLTDDAQNALSEVKVEKSITVDAYTPLQILFLESIQPD